MQLIVRAWRGTIDERGEGEGSGGPDRQDEPLRRVEWETWRQKETRRQQRDRRQREGVARIREYCRLVWGPERARQRARARWGRVAVWARRVERAEALWSTLVRGLDSVRRMRRRVELGRKQRARVGARSSTSMGTSLSKIQQRATAAQRRERRERVRLMREEKLRQKGRTNRRGDMTRSMVGQVLMAKLRRLERRDDGDDSSWQSEAGTWRETEETESCDDREDDQHDEDRGPTTRRSEMDEWEEELEADIELERRELGQSPPEDHEDWAND